MSFRKKDLRLILFSKLFVLVVRRCDFCSSVFINSFVIFVITGFEGEFDSDGLLNARTNRIRSPQED